MVTYSLSLSATKVFLHKMFLDCQLLLYLNALDMVFLDCLLLWCFKTVSLFPGILFICNITLQMEMKISSCLQGLQQLVKIISVELVAFVL